MKSTNNHRRPSRHRRTNALFQLSTVFSTANHGHRMGFHLRHHQQSSSSTKKDRSPPLYLKLFSCSYKHRPMFHHHTAAYSNDQHHYYRGQEEEEQQDGYHHVPKYVDIPCIGDVMDGNGNYVSGNVSALGETASSEAMVVDELELYLQEQQQLRERQREYLERGRRRRFSSQHHQHEEEDTSQQSQEHDLSEDACQRCQERPVNSNPNQSAFFPQRTTI